MLLKRILVLLISLAVGAVITTGLVMFVLGTSVAEYGAFYFSMTSLFLGLAVAIWLDKFMGTNFLPE
jgi:hypothetical protein